MQSKELSYLSDLLELGDDIRITQLEAEIDYLLEHNQERLMWLLYRLDVSEQKLMAELAESKEEGAKTITKMLLARCAQILETRKNYKSNESPDWSFDLE